MIEMEEVRCVRGFAKPSQVVSYEDSVVGYWKAAIVYTEASRSIAASRLPLVLSSINNVNNYLPNMF